MKFVVDFYVFMIYYIYNSKPQFESEVFIMLNYSYILFDTVKLNRREFEAFLINYITKHHRYNLRGLLGDTCEVAIIHHVKHHPYRLAKELLGVDNVILKEA